MDRRYYKLKALVIALGVGTALWTGVPGSPHFSMAKAHYGAALSVQTAVAQTTATVSRTVAGFILRRDCFLRTGF